MPKSVLDQIGKEHTEEVERLRQQNAELVKALRSIAGCGTAWFTARKIAKTAIAKATGGE